MIYAIIMLLKHLILKASKNPKQLFLIDGFGAILSAFLLGVMLIKYEHVFGIPRDTLYFLATFPILFSAYDFYCYFLESNKTGLPLKVIATLNLLYCLISIAMTIYHFTTITVIGWIYILLEIILVLFLAMIEFKVGKNVTLN